MKRRGMLARPNLKLFLLGALLIAVLHDLVSNNSLSGNGFTYTAHARGVGVSDKVLEKWLAQVQTRPDYQLYLRISYAYECRGEPRKAVHYLRLAEALDNE